MTKWFRFYADAMRNPKVAALSDREFRLWVQVLSVASENEGRVPPADELKHMLKARLDHLLTGIERLISAGLMDRLDRGYEPHNWKKFQYKSDTSTERVRRHREERNVSETPPEADTEAEKKEPIAQRVIAAPPLDRFDHLLESLLAAAGIQGFRQERDPGLVSVGAILALIERGYDLETDILPVIRDKCRNGFKPRIWGYFTDAIIEAATKKRAIPVKPAAAQFDWQAAVDLFRADGTWSHAWGPKPGERGCRVPAELLNRQAA